MAIILKYSYETWNDVARGFRVCLGTMCIYECHHSHKIVERWRYDKLLCECVLLNEVSKLCERTTRSLRFFLCVRLCTRIQKRGKNMIFNRTALEEVVGNL